jgi:hypothetical protein
MGQMILAMMIIDVLIAATKVVGIGPQGILLLLALI